MPAPNAEPTTSFDQPTRFDETLLDNPIWNSLRTEHRSLALSEGAALRYPPPIGPLAGAPDQSPESYEGLWTLAGPGGILGLFLPDPPAPPSGWTLIRTGILVQMICRTPQLVEAGSLGADAELRRLGSGDVPRWSSLRR